MFGPKKQTIATFGSLSASIFTYDSGVEAIRLENSLGGLTILPYHGQQIWRCDFLGRELTMKSIFDEPTGSRDYLMSYGGFLLHCGATAMGVPSDQDDHPLHGDLPNAAYRNAAIIAGSDEKGRYLSVTGRYEHKVAFNCRYSAEPTIKLREKATGIDVGITISNLRAEPMPLMYMMHINFRPEDNAELFYTAPKTSAAVRVHNSVPGHIKSGHIEDLKAFMDKLETDPTLHHVLKADLPLDPEVVFTVHYEADSEGWAKTMLRYPDGTGAYVSHRPDELPVGIRWLSRKGDEEAAGICLPATAEHKGFSAELEKGNVQYLEAHQSRTFRVKTGLLDSGEAKHLADKIG